MPNNEEVKTKRNVSIFLLRGLVREERHWGPFKDKIASMIPNSLIETPQIPGVGSYNQMQSPTSFTDMINFMRNKIDWGKHQKNERVLIAISLGGMIARQWTDLYENDFDKIILINTSYKGINPIYRRLQPLSILRFVKILFTPTIKARENAIIKLSSNNENNRLKHIENWVEIQNDRPVSRMNFFRQITAALKYNAPKTPPKKPIIVISSKADKLCHVKCSEQIHEIWGGKLYLHESAGHDLPIDDPDWLISKIKENI